VTISLRQRRPLLLQPLDDFTARHFMFMSLKFMLLLLQSFTVAVSYVSFCGRYEFIGLVPFLQYLWFR